MAVISNSQFCTECGELTRQKVGERCERVVDDRGQGSVCNGYVLAPIPMLLWCPACGERHIDTGEFATRVHHTHACQSCGMVWRPSRIPTLGVQFLPGFKNAGEGVV